MFDPVEKPIAVSDKQMRSVRAFGKLLEEIHVIWTQSGKKWDNIEALHEVTFKECVQCLETAFGFVVTPSELTSDGDKTFVTVSEHNRLNETQEDSANATMRPGFSKATPSRGNTTSIHKCDKAIGLREANKGVMHD
ncbi:hypothetical protein Tco_0134291 [Tanacetum coccineum]